MKRIVSFAGLALALCAPAFAQDTTTTQTQQTEQTQQTQPTEQPRQEQDWAEQDPAQAQGATEQPATGQTATMRQGRRTRGRAEGDPPFIDHSADTLIVDPPVSSFTIQQEAPIQ